MTAPHAALLMLGSLDPAFSTVVQLAHCNGANDSTVITNSCPRGNTMVFGAGGAIKTAQSVFGGASARIALVAAAAGAHADHAYGTNDFTIEFWFRPDTVATANIFDQRQVGAGESNKPTPTIYTLNTGSLHYFASNVTRISSGTGVVVNATWIAIALSRVSGTTRLFANGVSVGSFSDSIDYTYGGELAFGSRNASTQTNAYYDELRVSNGLYGAGAGRYAANYTVATAPFPNQ